MTSAASIAQFMAMMNGGINPNAMKKTLETFDGQKVQKPQDFNAALTLQDGQQTVANLSETGVVIQPVLQSNAAVKTPLSNDDVPTITIGANGALLPASSSTSALTPTQNNMVIDVASLSNNELEEFVTLALEVKGINAQDIDQLRDIFGDEVLMTIIQDPVMNAQLDEKLLEVGIISFQPKAQIENDTVQKPGTIETEGAPVNIAALVSEVLSDNQNLIQNTLTFKVDEEKQIDELIKTLIQRDMGDGQDLSFEIVANAQTLTPNFMALVQTQTASQNAKPSITSNPLPMAIEGFDPFGQRPMNIFAASSAPDAALPSQNMDAVLQSVMNKNPQSIGTESIADRLAGMLNNAQNANTATASFDAIMSQFSANNTLMTDSDLLSMMPLEAALNTAKAATNPMLSAQPALMQSHPTSHMVAMSMIKSSGQNINGQDTQSYRLQLDPPEMGRLDIQLEMLEGTAQMKAVISAEKPETLNMLQRDMHVLLKAMQDAGFENMSQQDFTFNLSQDNDFDMGGRGNGQGREDTPLMNGELVEMEILNTEMTDIIDPITGQRSINMVV